MPRLLRTGSGVSLRCEINHSQESDISDKSLIVLLFMSGRMSPLSDKISILNERK